MFSLKNILTSRPDLKIRIYGLELYAQISEIASPISKDDDNSIESEVLSGDMSVYISLHSSKEPNMR